jgi:hypothetical protein
MKTSQLLTGLAVLALATPVFAQGAPPPPPGPPPPGGTGLEGWPEPISDRPYTLNGGMLEVHGSLPILKDGQGGDSLVVFGGGASFGVSDQIEIGGDYAFLVSPNTDAAGIFAGHLLYRLVHNDHMSAAIGGAVVYSHAADGFIVAGGLDLRFRFSKELSLYTGTGGVPICGTCVSILGPVTGQAVIAVPNGGGDTAFYLNLPVGLAFQASPQFYLFADTSLATLLLSPRSDSLVEFGDYIGFHGGAWITASKNLEIGGSFADDLKHAGDLYLIEVNARIFL